MDESCKRTLEITVPLSEVESETERAVEHIQKHARIPGFRPGKVPAAMIKTRFAGEIRQEVVEALVPKFFRRRAEQDNLKVVGTPDITDIHFHAGEPIQFKAEFEVAPEFELQEYVDLTVAYSEPEVTDADVEKRIEDLREQKAEYVNIDPRPIENGDYAVLSLHSVSGVEGKPIDQDETVLHVGDENSVPEFNQNLPGLSPGEEKEFDVNYGEDYGEARLAGKTVRFKVQVKGIRKKELPELNDAFAQDLGDYKSLEELREAVRKSIQREREYNAQQEAKNKLVDQLVEKHQFAVPETFIERQIEIIVEQRMRLLALQGVDPRNLKLDWQKLKETQRERAVHDVKASLILDRIADREAISAMQDEVDREVQRIARQEREPVAAVRQRLEKDGAIGRIAMRIRTDKVLDFIFQKARKVAE